MTFDQIAIMARCSVEVKVDWLNAVLQPIMGAFGAEYKPAEGSKKTREKRINRTVEDRKQEDGRKLTGLALAGIPIE